MSFTIFDIVVLSVLTASCMFGMYRGLIKVSISFIAFIASLSLACYLDPYTESFLSKHIENVMVLNISSGIVSYILALAVCSFLSSKLIVILQNMSGGITDRFLGLIAGFTRGGVICMALFITIVIITTKSYYKANNLKDIYIASSEDKYPYWLKNSLTFEYLNHTTRNLIAYLPIDYLEEIKLPVNEKGIEDKDYLEKRDKQEHDLDSGEETINEELDLELDKSL